MTATKDEVTPRQEWLARRAHGAGALFDRRQCGGCYVDRGKRRTCGAWPEHPKRCPGGRTYWVLGRVELGMFFLILGTGCTPQRALADANRRRRR